MINPVFVDVFVFVKIQYLSTQGILPKFCPKSSCVDIFALGWLTEKQSMTRFLNLKNSREN